MLACHREKSSLMLFTVQAKAQTLICSTIYKSSVCVCLFIRVSHKCSFSLTLFCLCLYFLCFRANHCFVLCVCVCVRARLLLLRPPDTFCLYGRTFRFAHLQLLFVRNSYITCVLYPPFRFLFYYVGSSLAVAPTLSFWFHLLSP